MKKLELTKEQGQTVRNFLNNYYTEYKDNNDRLPLKRKWNYYMITLLIQKNKQPTGG